MGQFLKMPTVSKIPQAEWDKHKDSLYALYITDDRQLEEVVERAKIELGFFARFVSCPCCKFGSGNLMLVTVRLSI